MRRVRLVQKTSCGMVMHVCACLRVCGVYRNDDLDHIQGRRFQTIKNGYYFPPPFCQETTVDNERQPLTLGLIPGVRERTDT